MLFRITSQLEPTMNRQQAEGTMTNEVMQSETGKQRACRELKDAVDGGTLGDVLDKFERLIVRYYEDVQKQAMTSFEAAKTVAWVGFTVLIATLVYVLVFDALDRFQVRGLSINSKSFTVESVGVISGILIETIAGVNFWLYARASRQFSAFHICLERTHRYILAHKISSEIEENRDQTVRDLVCIMAHAPMITRQDIEADDYKPDNTAKDVAMSAVAAKV
jgi:hypothetical protein